MPTIKDIALLAGVSVTTVSRALNGYSDVSEATRQKIKKIAEELNYTPNSIARGLVMKKTNTVGLVVSEIIKPGVYHPFFLEVLSGIKAALHKSGYDIILFTVDPESQGKTSYERLCKERKVDGTIVQGLKLSDPYIEQIKSTDIPTVLIDIPILTERVGYVSSDNVKGAFDAVNYLVQIGHSEIGFINGHKDAAVSIERLEGYRKALEHHGIPYDERYVAYGDYTQQSGAEAFKELLREIPQITAVFCASDLMAVGALKAAGEMGKKVPGEISIVGFDDIELATIITPNLTTIRQEKYRIGYKAAELLLSIIRGEKPRHVVVPHRLVVRQSTRALRTGCTPEQ
ncbi:LacI family DNA-binding transcriptional regulator [Thermosediminibacter oceani]|uniref:Transcriptional regulator, LacI family n=1 Tax=Thermosediminibacter oceani (strain ATCC BAA-1034 / DSM 16646 / JW/IW-1228P) TaxID=555079 RepID=D9RYP4_THEOJ|nr:LacI family DNA-binding transcriptional regulator [Thermosediminibacter oceani]ADL08468.1 transcriptional regulator, LacI family [Thermosediminibacter oceani DSM 16646]